MSSKTQPPRLYRSILDALVVKCRSGAGQISADRVRAGLWNASATATFLPDLHELNGLLERLPASDREVLARALVAEFESGVFETLETLESFAVPPFDTNYEGSPYNDFVGRLNDWEWPTS